MIAGLAHALKNALKRDYHLVRTDHGWASVFTIESPRKQQVRVLDVGGAYQSATYMDRRRFQPVFAYYRAFDAVFQSPRPIRHALMIGGGGCAWPKHAITTHPHLSVDAVEADAGIIDAARRFFFVDELEKQGRLRLIAEEGRRFLEKSPRTYDAILNDAFSGDEPAYGLATVEAAAAIEARLNPGGMYLSNVVSRDEGTDIEFLRDAAAALCEVFPYVQVIPCPDFDYSDEDNYLLAASQMPLDLPGALPLGDEFLGLALRD